MNSRRASLQKGFTIIELLIVIVVIAVLAAITVVAFTNIRQRAANTKTVQAVAEWVKILNMYKAHNGAYPSVTSCLGAPGSYDTSLGCRRDTSSGGMYQREDSFYTAIQNMPGEPSSYPTPTVVRYGTSYPYYIGAYWLPVVTPQRLDYVVQGTDAANCGVVGGATLLTSAADTATNTRRCLLTLE